MHRLLLNFSLLLLFIVSLNSCQKSDVAPEKESPTVDNTKYLGADLSLLTRFEQNKAIYQNEQGRAIEVLPFFKENGFNYVRYRLFVNPDLKSDACQNLDYVISLCKRSKEQGFKILLDFHYSDTWADPGKQTKPLAWQNLTQNQLVTKIYDYTKSVLLTMNDAGVLPDMIQTGNEISPGMLWDEGRVSLWKDVWNTNAHWTAFTNLLKSAISACREVAVNAKIMVHTERSGMADETKEYYTQLQKYGVDYDIIGLSYYPYWHGTLSQVESTIQTLAQSFNKEVVFVETAYPYADFGYPTSSVYPKIYPSTPAGQAQFIKDLIILLRKYPNVKGLFYWFAEETYSPNETNPTNMHSGLFDDKTGKVLPALKEMSTFLMK